mmetsp:Transcript_7536/g.16017  ORF Transcript_7536/g.16017 Transcript_7536/m.16017 type:complete len:391 (-) Transcript_7536:747-1919(-)
MRRAVDAAGVEGGDKREDDLLLDVERVLEEERAERREPLRKLARLVQINAVVARLDGQNHGVQVHHLAAHRVVAQRNHVQRPRPRHAVVHETQHGQSYGHRRRVESALVRAPKLEEAAHNRAMLCDKHLEPRVVLRVSDLVPALPVAEQSLVSRGGVRGGISAVEHPAREHNHADRRVLALNDARDKLALDFKHVFWAQKLLHELAQHVHLAPHVLLELVRRGVHRRRERKQRAHVVHARKRLQRRRHAAHGRQRVGLVARQAVEPLHGVRAFRVRRLDGEKTRHQHAPLQIEVHLDEQRERVPPLLKVLQRGFLQKKLRFAHRGQHDAVHVLQLAPHRVVEQRERVARPHPLVPVVVRHQRRSAHFAQQLVKLRPQLHHLRRRPNRRNA